MVVGIQLPGNANQDLGEVGVDTPVSLLVCFGQCIPGNVFSNAGMVELGLHGTQAAFDVPKALSVGQLSEIRAEELVQTGERSYAVTASIPAHACVELVPRQEVHQLRENDPSRIHRPLLSTSQRKKNGRNVSAV